MIEVLSSNDPVRISFAQAVLKEADIHAVTLDENTSALFGGALPWIKRRILVADEDRSRAQYALAQAFKAEGIQDDDSAQ